jgi:hypothetical protein
MRMRIRNWFQYYRPLTGLLATLGKNKYFSGGCQYPVIMYGTGEYEQNTNLAVTRGHSITGYHKQCCGSEMIFFSDPDPNGLNFGSGFESELFMKTTTFEMQII